MWRGSRAWRHVLTDIHRWMNDLALVVYVGNSVYDSRIVKSEVKTVIPPTMLNTFRTPRTANQLHAVNLGTLYAVEEHTH